VSAPRPCAGVVCLRGDEVLLIRRGKPPRMGEWSIPGGGQEFGETIAAAALRELAEETGVSAEILGLIEVLDDIGDQRHNLLVDFAARWLSGEPVAGDDAVEARFAPLDEALRMVQWAETRRIIAAGHARFGGGGAQACS
jgi:8-oxo-dGTP diphosphatase